MYITIIRKFILFLYIINNVQSFENETLGSDNATIASRRAHQITSILDGLLKDYQAHIRPNFGGKIKYIVFFIYLFHIFRKSNKNKLRYIS
jgi:hypothetical protein